MILILIAIPADANLLNGYALNGSVLVGYVLDGYVLVGYVLVGYVCDSCWCTPFEWICIEWIRIAWIRIGGIRVEGKGISGIRIGGIRFEWICVQNRCKPFEWIRIEWIRTGGIRVERIRIGGIRIGGIRFEWICVGYVWCAGYVWDMCGVRYANNLLKNPATKRLSGKNVRHRFRWFWVSTSPWCNRLLAATIFSTSQPDGVNTSLSAVPAGHSSRVQNATQLNHSDHESNWIISAILGSVHELVWTKQNQTND